MANKGYVLLLVSYGLNAGVFYAMSTLLNQTVLIHFPVRINFLGATSVKGIVEFSY